MEDIIRVLMVPPHQPPCVAYLCTTINALRCAVSIGADELGEVKAKRLDANTAIIYNEDYFLSGLDGNRRVADEIITGTFYVLAYNMYDQPVSLSDTQIEVLSGRFAIPEHFTYTEVLEANLDAMFRSIAELE